MNKKQLKTVSFAVIVLTICYLCFLIVNKSTDPQEMKRYLQVQQQQSYQTAIPSVKSLQNQTWVQIFRDDFNRKKLNTSIWNVANYMYHTDWEQTLYQGYNVYVQNGNLVIKTKFDQIPYNDTGRDYNYTTRWIDSQDKFFYKYGYAEVRIKFSKMVQNDLIWPAFWSLGTQMYWPTGGEIDTLEVNCNWGTNGQAKAFRTNHWGPKHDVDMCYACGTKFNGKLDFTQYHNYTSVWNETQIDWYIDGNLYRTVANGTKIDSANGTVELPKWNHYFIFNQAIWEGATPNPQDYPKYMYVDYVTVLQPLQTYLNQQQKH
ncbi:hypothetical protein ABPG72_016645 [Tetrahymena utriculariae]